MLKHLLLLTFLFISSTLLSQELSIPNTKLVFELPNDEWEMTEDREIKEMHLLSFQRKPIIDDSGRSVSPNISFITEEIGDSMNVIMFSAYKRSKVPFNVEEVFSHDFEGSPLKYKNAIGYVGNYTEGPFKHIIYVIHLKDGESGVQVIMDITESLFEEYRKEFEKSISSIKKR